MLKFYLIEDDPAVRKMLIRIVGESGLGEVVGEADDGSYVTLADVSHADIVIIDLLMPGRDGIETVKALRENDYSGRFIMISQVENKEMIGEAYQQGVDTFIQKPINRLEVLAVLRRVSDHLLLEKSMKSIRNSLRTLEVLGTGALHAKQEHAPVHQEKLIEQRARSLLLQLGVVGEAGASDMIRIVNWLKTQEQEQQILQDLPPLKTIYEQITLRGQAAEEHLKRDIRATEQRIRRLTLQALTNLSSIGLSDYGNPTFEYFAARMFDFQEVRLRMRELETSCKSTSCKINLRKFLYVFYIECSSAS